MAFRSQAGQVAVMHREVTKSDTVDLPDGVARAIYVGGAGVIAIVDPTDTVINYTVVAGERLDIACKRVNSTDTTATSLVAWY